MRLPTVTGSRASCGHILIGNPNVLVGGLPIGVVGESIAGGIVGGPGATRVFVGGMPVSLVGDSVAPHGKSPHTTATLIDTIPGRVFVI